MSEPKVKLTPPDRERCQAEITPGSFMTLGPRTPSRCKNKPAFIITENKPGSDGQIGSMSLCESCAEVFRRKMGDDFATFKPIRQFAVYVVNKRSIKYIVDADSAEEARAMVEGSKDADEEFDGKDIDGSEWYVDDVEECL